MCRRESRPARAGNKYRAVEVSGGVEKERDYFGRRDDRYDDRRDRGYDRRGYDDDRGRVERYRPRDRYDDRRGRTTTTAATAGATTTTAATTAARQRPDTPPSPLLAFPHPSS